MPSDCQCSSACGVVEKEVVKVLNDKQATRRIRELEEEVERLLADNSLLSKKLRRESTSKKDLIKKLKDGLDRI